MAEIDDTELARLHQAENVLSKLLSPTTSKEAHQLIKKHYPEHHVPIDPEEVRASAAAAAQKVLDDREAEQRKKKLEDEFQADLNSYRLSPSNPDGFTDEGIERLKSFMREKTIPNVHAAVLLMEKEHPVAPQVPSGYMPTGWNFGAPTKDEDRKLLFTDEDAWADQEARKVWEEHRRNNPA